jgi:hypothetical protein
MSKAYQFYALFNEEFPQEWRYIGVTSKQINERFSHHKYCATHDSHRALPVHKWMHSVYSKGGKIGWTKIHECSESEWEYEEQRLISENSKVHELLNLDKGGKGVITKDNRDKSGIERSIEAHKKSIVQLDKNGNLVQEFDAITSASEITGISRTSIGNCLKGRSKTAGGYVWTYKEYYSKAKVSDIPSSRGRNIRVFKYSPDMELICEFNSISKAISGVCKSGHTLTRHLDTNELYGGFYWFTSKQVKI